ncbi:hypothetical protein BD626DRAFT_401115 [Schizophyllum amplum]|uniref:PARP catalytic domain-containing protein n=1 Tax=Schizophyllum amplum TaxID=97359 RepID=A0A550CI41_9AGAR|nr:hypothetical protein BD626DRAFT_401115 [Auriculariopsis ampla]
MCDGPSADDTCRTLVESRGHFTAKNLPVGNETRRWYGTYRECLIGESEQQYPCASVTCRLCSIIRTDFDLSAQGKKLPIGAFGRAIYTSSSTNTADEFSANRVLNSTTKAMILADIVVGKPKIVHVDRPLMREAPRGYDSVMAKKGFFLAHDDIMIYSNDAIRPAYLVMYDV